MAARDRAAGRCWHVSDHRIKVRQQVLPALPSVRDLRDLLNDGSIWLNHDPASADWGATSIPHPTEVSINSLAFRWGRWSVLATLVHELAHVNGARWQ